ncbi:hypothetical protein ACFCV3_41690 [Kribbella sp. NPDC056345]|uniref:DUF6919 domain-containing protein n=1 Tax=Kribbella sp. NPDC056345 TaxID=3345789 RepID=UPI0035D5C449
MKTATNAIAWLKTQWAHRRRRAASKKQWLQADSLADLGLLTARWLEGDLAFHTNGYDVPDEETLPLVPVLAAVNRAGFVTEGSQPGVIEDDGGMQRATVQGYVDDEQLLWSIVAAARVRGLICIVNTAGSPIRQGSVVVTSYGASFGSWMSASAIRLMFGACNRTAVKAVSAAVQVTVIDPVWGRDTVLWSTLTAAVTALDGKQLLEVTPGRLDPDPAPYVAEWSAPIGPTKRAVYLSGPGEHRMTKPVLVARDPEAPFRAVEGLPYEVTAEGLADWRWWAAA